MLIKIGIKPRYLPYSWGRVCVQGERETWSSVARRATAERQIAITRGTAGAAAVLQRWTPASGSVWLEGRTGTGKTLMAVATVRALVEADVASASADVHRHVDVDDLPPRARAHAQMRLALGLGRPVVRVPPVRTSILFASERKLQDDARSWVGARMSGKFADDAPPSPLDLARTVDVLVLDDMGTADLSKGWPREVEGILDERYSARKPVIFTGNMPLDGQHGVATTYRSDRLVSRLLEMIGQRRVVVSSEVDWRSPDLHGVRSCA